MKIQVLADADSVAKAAPQFIAAEARAAVAARGRFIIAVSGGRTPWQMLRDLAGEDVPSASFAGSFAARNILGNADADYKKYYFYFSNRRHFTLPAGLARLISKPILFSLTNASAKFYQVDSHRRTAEMKGEF
jgi:hypothetical protein